MTLGIAMMYDEKGQEDQRRPVYLPENRHHWAANDEVDKPAVDLSRGPVRARFKRKSKKPNSSKVTASEWMRANLPRIGATAIAAVVILCVIFALYTDLAGVLLN